MKMLRVTAAVMALSVSAQATAASLVLYPVQTGAEVERFRQGVPTLDLVTQTGAVAATPLAFDHGYVSLGVSVFNSLPQPANFGVENITATANGQPLQIFTRDDLDRKAKNRAMWSAIGTAALTGLAAGVASGITNTYVQGSSVRVGRFSATSVGIYRDHTPGLIAASEIGNAGASQIAMIHDKLDYTLDHLAHEIVQTSTVDPGQGYGGRIVIAGNDKLKAPYDLRIVVSWNGNFYPFTFRVTHDGEAKPAPFVGAPASLASMAPVQAGSLPAAPVPGPASAPQPMPAVYVPSAPVAPAVHMAAASYAPPSPVAAPQVAQAAPASDYASFDAGKAAAAAALAAASGGTY